MSSRLSAEEYELGGNMKLLPVRAMSAGAYADRERTAGD